MVKKKIDFEKKALEEIKREVLRCKKCFLSKTRKHSVFGKGNIRAEIMFIGEAPGFWEDEKGEPFCGRAGKILDKLLEIAGLKREEVFITNLVKCRPPENRKPTLKEILACAPFLEKQIEIIKPKIISPLGFLAIKFVLKSF